jgi:hypothetical protein
LQDFFVRRREFDPVNTGEERCSQVMRQRRRHKPLALIVRMLADENHACLQVLGSLGEDHAQGEEIGFFKRRFAQMDDAPNFQGLASQFTRFVLGAVPS